MKNPADLLSPQVPDLRAMFEARKRVFVDLLKWDIPVLADRYELDEFDTADATYLMLTDASGNHRASTRLLLTDRPHILTALFPCLCEEAPPAGPAVREITRFCLEPTLCAAERRIARNQLVTALVNHALDSGLSDYTGVAEPRWFRQIEQFGWECRALGPVRTVGNHNLVALHIRIDRQTPTRLEEAGIYSAAELGLVAAGGVQ